MKKYLAGFTIDGEKHNFYKEHYDYEYNEFVGEHIRFDRLKLGLDTDGVNSTITICSYLTGWYYEMPYLVGESVNEVRRNLLEEIKKTKEYKQFKILTKLEQFINEE